MTAYVIDAYAWVEYFAGSDLGAVVCGIVEEEENLIVTNAITIAELASKFKRSGKEFSEAKKVLLSLSRVQDVNGAFSEEAGTLHAELRTTRKHLGLADAFVIATARRHKAKIVTGDQDFKGLKDVVLLK